MLVFYKKKVYVNRIWLWPLTAVMFLANYNMYVQSLLIRTFFYKIARLEMHKYHGPGQERACCISYIPEILNVFRAMFVDKSKLPIDCRRTLRIILQVKFLTTRITLSNLFCLYGRERHKLMFYNFYNKMAALTECHMIHVYIYILGAFQKRKPGLKFSKSSRTLSLFPLRFLHIFIKKWFMFS